MNAMLQMAGPGTRAALGLGLDVVVRSAIVIALALVLHGVLGKRRVLVRSVLWNACLLGLLALPAATLAIPGIRLSLLPARPEGPAPPASVLDIKDMPEEPVLAAASISEPLPAIAPLPQQVAEAPPPVEASASSMPWWRRHAFEAILLAYVIVAAGLLIRLAISLQAVARLRRASLTIDKGPWNDAIARWSERLGIRRQVALACSERLGGPVVVGCFRPTIVLPVSLARSTTPAVIDAVVVHELAHVRRADFAWNLLLRIVQALYWPQPLAWLLGPIVASVREQACDELCVYCIGDSTGYRTTLLDIAEAMVQRPREALGLAMAGPTRLRRRLAHLATTKGAARCLLGWPLRGVIVLLVVAAVGLLGSVRLARSAAAQTPKTGATAKDSPAVRAAPAEPPPVEPQPAPEPQPKTEPKIEPEQPKTEPEVQPEPRSRPGPEGNVVEVTVVKPRREPWARLASASCTFQILNPTPVYARVAGRVAAKGLASVGDRVKKGDLLAEIEDTNLPVELGKARVGLRQAMAKKKQAQGAVAVARAAVVAADAKIEEMKVAVQQARNHVATQSREVQRVAKMQQQNVVSQSEVDLAKDKLSAAETDVAAAERRLLSAEAALAQAKAQLLAVDADVEAVVADVEDAQAEIDRVNDLFKLTRVTSPIDGVVYTRNVDAGSPSLRDRGGPLFVVAPTNALMATIGVAENLASRVKVGHPVTIYPTGAPRTQPIQSKIQRVAAELQAGQLQIEFEVPNAEERLRPGGGGLAVITLEDPHQALTIPVECVNVPNRLNLDGEPDGEAFCVRVVDGRAVVTPVKLGLRNANRVEVLEGLKDDDSLILDLVTEGRIMELPLQAITGALKGKPLVKVVDQPQPSPRRRGGGGFPRGQRGLGGFNSFGGPPGGMGVDFSVGRQGPGMM